MGLAQELLNRMTEEDKLNLYEELSPKGILIEDCLQNLIDIENVCKKNMKFLFPEKYKSYNLDDSNQDTETDKQ